ncbi:MAG: thymidylate kinase [Terracidiphilus sp.]
MRNLRNITGVRIVSFSGVDGAGKSTQIERLCECLKERGLRVRHFRFWDDIARLKRFREGAGHTIFNGDKGIGSPEAPINRRDKNVGGWLMTCFRYFLYLADAISLRIVFQKALRSNVDVVIFDRYTYDELANLNLAQPLTRIYAHIIMHFIPRPEISFVLDADPVAARARKPEYPIEFVRMNRRAYVEMNRLFGGFTIIAPMGVEAAHREVKMRTLSILMSQQMATDDRCAGSKEPVASEGANAGQAFL